jgi:hypothetical protein
MLLALIEQINLDRPTQPISRRAVSSCSPSAPSRQSSPQRGGDRQSIPRSAISRSRGSAIAACIRTKRIPAKVASEVAHRHLHSGR